MCACVSLLDNTLSSVHIIGRKRKEVSHNDKINSDKQMNKYMQVVRK